MKKIRALPESDFLKLFFGCFTLFFLVAAVCMPDRSTMFSGLKQILIQPCKVSTSYFSVGGYSATFLNMGLVAAICFSLFVGFRAEVNNVSTLAFILTTGFGAWGINILNMWPSIAGVFLYALVKKERLGKLVNAMLFSTGLAPLITDLMIRYPHGEVVGFSLTGILVAMAVGMFIGILMPAGMENSARVHKGFDLYSAAFPMGMLAFFLNAALFKTMGLELPSPGDTLNVVSPLICNTFCVILFTCCIAAAFALGGLSATFLNMALVGYICLGLFLVFHVKVNNVSTLAFILTTSFGSWGINPMNMWPSMLGVMLYGWIHKEKFNTLVHAMLFSTGLAPLISELLLRYPDADTVGFSFFGLIMAVVVGGFIGFFLPVGLANSPKIHKGFTLYSAALPMGMTAFFLNAALFKTTGFEHPDLADTLSVTAPVICNAFCIVLFASCIIAARMMGCTMKAYWRLLTDDKTIWDFSSYYGKHVFLMNVGVFGLFILTYYNLIGAPFNGVTFGIVICMLATCNSGSHPGNVWPIMLGYLSANILFGTFSYLIGGNFTTAINSQSMIVGLCYANGLSPIADKYGWKQGVIAAFLHYLLVTSVPNLHGGFCLYNGGFTAALVCIFLLPKLERYCQLKEPTRQRKSEDGHYDGKFKGPNPVGLGPVHGVVHDAGELMHHAGELVHQAGELVHQVGESMHLVGEHKNPEEKDKKNKTK